MLGAPAHDILVLYSHERMCYSESHIWCLRVMVWCRVNRIVVIVHENINLLVQIGICLVGLDIDDVGCGSRSP